MWSISLFWLYWYGFGNDWVQAHFTNNWISSHIPLVCAQWVSTSRLTLWTLQFFISWLEGGCSKATPLCPGLCPSMLMSQTERRMWKESCWSVKSTLRGVSGCVYWGYSHPWNNQPSLVSLYGPQCITARKHGSLWWTLWEISLSSWGKTNSWPQQHRAPVCLSCSILDLREFSPSLSLINPSHSDRLQHPVNMRRRGHPAWFNI